MIRPQKYSKSLGDKKLSGGITLREMVVSSFLPFFLNMIGVDPFFSFISFFILIALIALKNKILEPSYIKNSLEKKSFIEWERVKIND